MRTIHRNSTDVKFECKLPRDDDQIDAFTSVESVPVTNASPRAIIYLMRYIRISEQSPVTFFNIHHPNISCYTSSALIKPRSCAISPHNCTFLYLWGAAQLIRSYVAELVVSGKKAVLYVHRRKLSYAQRALSEALVPAARQKENATLREKCPSRYGLYWKERWQVMWHAIRKLRWHRSIHARNRQRGTRSRRINGGNANLQYSLTRHLSRFASRETEKPYLSVYVCRPPFPQKKIPRQSNWNLRSSTSLHASPRNAWYDFFFYNDRW